MAERVLGVPDAGLCRVAVVAWTIGLTFAFAPGCGGKASTCHDCAGSAATGGSGPSVEPDAGPSAEPDAGLIAEPDAGAPPAPLAVDGFGCPGLPEVPQSGALKCGVQVECEIIGQSELLLIERSAAMLRPWGGSSRWQMVRELFSGNTLFGGGLQFFGADPSILDRCDPRSYSRPAVWFERTTSMAQLDGYFADAPAGGSPLLSAIEGALAFLREKRSALGQSSALTLILGSEPDECPAGVSMADIAEVIRRAAEEEPPIVANIIQLGSDVDAAPLALAAGSLFLVDEDDAPALLRDALQRVDYPCRICELDLSTPSEITAFLDTTEVVIGASSKSESLPRVASLAACAESPNGGFYLDAVAETPSVKLCPCSCNRQNMGIRASYECVLP